MYLPTGSRFDKYYGTFIALAALGLAGWAGYTAVRWTLSYRWPAVPCIIQTSRVAQVGGENPYFFEVAYRYKVQGQPLVGGTYQEDYRGSWNIAEAERLARAYPVGAKRLCCVNPSKPSEAVLEHDNIWMPAALALGMLLDGAFLARFFLRPARPGAAPNQGIGILGGMFLLLAGLGAYVMFLGLPLSTGLRSFRWVPVPCVVESAKVRSVHHHADVSFTVYWPDIVYRYQVNGISHRANVYNASDVGSPWYYGSRNTVRLYPAGKKATCYVNPDDPFEAVLDRTLSGTQWFGLWPLIMAVLGAAGIIQTLTGRDFSIGSSRSWGSLALAMATGFSVLILIETGDDLILDRKAGIAEPMEHLVVAVAGLVSAVLLTAWIRLALKHGNGMRMGTGPSQPVVWDQEFDG